MLSTRAQNAQRVTTIRIDCDGDARHLFSDLPLRMDTGAAAEKESLLTDDGRARPRKAEGCDEWLPRRMYAISAVICTLFLIAIVVAVAVLMAKVQDTINSVDSAVGLTPSAVNAIRNIDTLLNRSAQLADTAHRLGVQGLDASLFSKPYLTRILNSSTALVESTSRLAAHPHIAIGG